jgi:hypothetical protein
VPKVLAICGKNVKKVKEEYRETSFHGLLGISRSQGRDLNTSVMTLELIFAARPLAK